METGISVSTNVQGDSQKHALMTMTKKEKLPNGMPSMCQTYAVPHI